MSSHKHISPGRRSLYTLEDDDDEYLTDEQRRRRDQVNFIRALVKIAIFLMIWMFFAVLLIIKAPRELNEIVMPLQADQPEIIEIKGEVKEEAICITIYGQIDVDCTEYFKKPSRNQSHMIITVEKVMAETNITIWKSKKWIVYLAVNSRELQTVKRYIRIDNHGLKKSLLPPRRLYLRSTQSNDQLQLSLLNRHHEMIALSIGINTSPLNKNAGIIIGIVLLCFLYALIIWDITDRTFAAIMAATTAIGCLSLMNARPTLETIISWIDSQTLMLLFGMMILVAILSETGVFDFLSVCTYQLSRGNIWLLLLYLNLFCALVSAFLDNVTIVQLMVPVTIRLCEALSLQTKLVLIGLAVFSNIGGSLTPVGSLPNVIIATNSYVASQGINFINFTLHMGPGVLISLVIAIALYFFMIRNKISEESNQMQKTLKTLEKQYNKLSDKDKQRSIELQIRIDELKERLKHQDSNEADFKTKLQEFKSVYKIRNRCLLIKSCIALGFAIIIFFSHPFLAMHGVLLCWTTILAALLLIILTNSKDMDTILTYVEWSSLIFFAALFIFMEALVELGLMDWISGLAIKIIMSVNKEHQLAVSILLLLWISAVTSALVDNIPTTTMLLKLTISIAKNRALGLPLAPLIWSLAFGACLGGNGTLIGASPNVMMVGLARQQGYTINFRAFIVIGFPIMILTVIATSIYLLIVHCLLTWH